MKDIVCVTGGTGFLGRELVEILKKDFEVRVSSREKKEFAGIQTTKVDFNSSESIRNFLSNANTLVHALAITDPGDKNLEKVNVELTKKLISQAIVSKNIKKIIYISSENVTYNLQDAYTTSKKKAEQIVSKFKNHLILRPSIILGKGDNRYVMQFCKLIYYSPIIPVISGKNSLIQPVHVTDVANIVLKGIKKDIAGAFTLVGTDPLSFKMLGKFISDIYCKKRVFIEVPSFLIKLIIFLSRMLQFRVGSMLQNALVKRNTDIANIQKAFSYTFPTLETRLKESLTKSNIKRINLTVKKIKHSNSLENL